LLVMRSFFLGKTINLKVKFSIEFPLPHP